MINLVRNIPSNSDSSIITANYINNGTTINSIYISYTNELIATSTFLHRVAKLSIFNDKICITIRLLHNLGQYCFKGGKKPKKNNLKGN